MTEQTMPTPKRQLAISYTDKAIGHIAFLAVPDVVESIRNAEFCMAMEWIDVLQRWHIRVNPLYDFDECLEWIKAQG